jgi:hypothetical protein
MAINTNARRSHIVREWLNSPKLAASRETRRQQNEAKREKMREQQRKQRQQ